MHKMNSFLHYYYLDKTLNQQTYFLFYNFNLLKEKYNSCSITLEFYSRHHNYFQTPKIEHILIRGFFNTLELENIVKDIQKLNIDKKITITFETNEQKEKENLSFYNNLIFHSPVYKVINRKNIIIKELFSIKRATNYE